MEFMCVILLGDEYSVDFLESRNANDHVPEAKMTLSNLEEGLYFLAKQN